MSSDPTGPILLLVVMLAVQAWLAAAEEALRCMSEARLLHDAEEGDPAARRLLEMNAHPERFVPALRTCMLLATLLTGVYASMSFSDRLAAWLTQAHGMGSGVAMALSVALVTIGLTLLILLLGDQTPRRIAAMYPEKIAKMMAGSIAVVAVILRPVTWLGERLSGALLRVAGVRPDAAQEEVTEDEIRLMVDIGGESGAIEEDEKEMIDNIFELNNRSAEDVMTHRTDVSSIWIGDDREAIVRTILETGKSRFPVYGEDIDDIIGVLNTRDFLLNMHADRPKSLRELLRQAYFVPEHVQADTLLRDMQKRKVHMAIVVDEYGGMSGIVTMEDLLEEIVGNIYDEFDRQGEAEITRLADNLWRIAGGASLEDVGEALGIDLPTEEDYDTLGGLVFNQLTTIPQDGSHPEVDAAGLHIRVERLEDHRVETAIVSRILDDVPEAEREDDHE